jgi:hypothetical protein
LVEVLELLGEVAHRLERGQRRGATQYPASASAETSLPAGRDAFQRLRSGGAEALVTKIRHDVA